MPSSKPSLISVVIPTYNRAEFLSTAIDSVLVQRLPAGWKMDVIVIDDGSTDNTKDVIRKFAKKLTYIKIAHSGKPAVARNVGLNHARGELVAFQDSDDIWIKDRLYKQLPYFEDSKVLLVHGGINQIDDKGVLVFKKSKASSGKISQTLFSDLVKTNNIATLTVTARKDILLKLGGFNESDDLRAVEDYELWLRISAIKGKMINLSDPLASHRIHDANISNDGLAPSGTSKYESMALERIVKVLESVLFNSQLSNSQVELVEKQLEQFVEGIFYIRNPQYINRSPTISVLLPAYNCEKFVADTIKSILSQTYGDFEIIAINDGSKDNTALVIKSFDDPRIKLFSQKNKGLVATCNRGINLCRGEFIARHDADDISMPTRFEKELGVITSNPDIGVVSSFFTYMDEHTNKPSITMAYPFKPIDVKRAFYLVNPIAHGSTLTRKSVFEAVGSYDANYIPAEDYKIWTSIADITDISIIPESLYWYRVNPSGLSATKYDEMLVLTDKIINEQWKKDTIYKGYHAIIDDGVYYQKHAGAYSKQVYEQYIQQQVRIGRGFLRHGHLIKGLKTTLASIKLDPSQKKLLFREVKVGVIKFLRKTLGRS